MAQTPYTVEEIAKNTWSINEEGWVRSFLLVGTREALLIDTGNGGGDMHALVTSLTDLPITLVNTHADGDHIGANASFGVSYMHPSEFDRFHRGRGKSLPVEPLWEGDMVDLGDRWVHVFLIPGHTPGSICLIDRENRMLFSGDSVQAGTIYMYGEGRSLPAYIASMQKLGAVLPHVDTIWSAHGDAPVTPEILSSIIDGAVKVLAGEIPPGVTNEQGATEYDIGVAKLLY